MSTDNIKEVVRGKYREAALRVGKGGSTCCGSAPSTVSGCCDPITSNLYDAARAGSGQGIDADAIAPQVDGKFMSAFVRAFKPAQSCCGPACCQ
jgi:hypothetical protein